MGVQGSAHHLAVRQSNVEQYHVDSAPFEPRHRCCQAVGQLGGAAQLLDLCQLARNEISIRGTVIDQQHVDFGELVHVESSRSK